MRPSNTVDALKALARRLCLPCVWRTKGRRLHSWNLRQFTSCRHQTSLTVGTIFDYTKLPLSTWFRSMYNLLQSRCGVSAIELMRRLGVSYNTAWMLNQKLMQVMLERETLTTLADRVEIDYSFIGGEHTSGTVGRGAPGKTPFVAALQTDWQGKPQRIALHKVGDFTNEQIEAFAKKKLKLTADVYTDGLASFAAVINQGCSQSAAFTMPKVHRYGHSLVSTPSGENSYSGPAVPGQCERA